MHSHRNVHLKKISTVLKLFQCLIYSFGVRDDWTFESTVSALGEQSLILGIKSCTKMMHFFYLKGCEVHAYDPTVDLSESKIPFKFYKVGVGHVDTKRDRTLGNLIKANGHQKRHITMIKMDVEGAERKGLKAWLDEGALDNVHQFALEYHLHDSKHGS